MKWNYKLNWITSLHSVHGGINYLLEGLTWIFYTLQQNSTDPRDPHCQNRKIASYLQYFWNGQLHKRPKFYDMNLTARQYNLCLHTRFLHSYLPVYHQLSKPFQDRLCPICQRQQLGPSDLKHVLSECPSTLLIYNQSVGELGPEALLFPQLLQSKNVDVWKYIATCLQLVLQQVHIRKKNTHTDYYFLQRLRVRSHLTQGS